MDEWVWYCSIMALSERERSPIEPRPLARASAEREVAESEEANNRNYKIVGATPESLSPQGRIFAVKKIAVLNERLLQSKGNRSVANEISLSREYEDLVTSNKLDTLDGALVKDKNDIEAEKRNCRSFVDIIYGPTIDLVTQYQLKEFELAETSAQRMYVDVASMYQDDELYKSLKRAVYGSPQAQADVMLAPVQQEGLRERAFEFVLVRDTNRAIALGKKRNIPDDEAKLLVRNHARSMRDSSEYRKKIANPFADYLLLAHYVMVGEEIEDLWGPDAVESLSPKVQGAILYYKEELAQRDEKRDEK
jgi:hypothetical protein